MGRALVLIATWILLAVLLTAVGLGVWEAIDMAADGRKASVGALEEIGQRVLDDTGYFLIAAGIGALLGLLAAMPGSVKSACEKIVMWTFLGALSGAVCGTCIMFVYFVVIRMRAGVAADALPLSRLVTEEMALQNYLPYGAIAGACVGALLIVSAQLRNASDARTNQHSRYSFDESDPDAMIRSQRADRAERYLAQRIQGS